MRRIIEILIISSLIVFFFSCQQKSEYHQILEREMASGIRYDSLFHGFYFGMPSKDFYSHCFKLNKKGLIRQGSTNQTVYAKITELEHPASMDFYPTFLDDKIAGMPVTFTYDSWAPWNKHLSADSLKLKVVDLMEEWYGPGFIQIKNPSKFSVNGGDAFVKVNGNRRISVYNINDTKVNVDFMDLTQKEKMEQVTKEAREKQLQKNKK